ncbi:NRDE family protein [Nocardiopsis sp. CNT312]|uniref:NRDE family protein n=1 Tax=Nocardiopsis sp. CNT312 TaxID=1137268 RepID=UPI00048D2A3D|nr:NRDE family protein [Nocardiopsis sp. CNT312]
MCTVIVGFDPGADTPLVIAAVRDEMRDRPWDGPGRHWPDHPDAVGGRDRSAGGTWLAVDTARARTAALLNGWPWDGRMPWEGTYPASRGDLPLRALAQHGRDALAEVDAGRYAPFHLLDADAHRAVLHSWDGRRLDTRPLSAGVSVIVNTGLDPAAPRVVRHRPEFARTRPDPAGLAAAPDTGEIWGDWVDLLAAAARDTPRSAGTGGAGDPSGLIAHAELGDGKVWATGSVTLVAADAGTVRHAFTTDPADSRSWRVVDV